VTGTANGALSRHTQCSRAFRGAEHGMAAGMPPGPQSPAVLSNASRISRRISLTSLLANSWNRPIGPWTGQLSMSLVSASSRMRCWPHWGQWRTEILSSFMIHGLRRVNKLRANRDGSPRLLLIDGARQVDGARQAACLGPPRASGPTKVPAKFLRWDAQGALRLWLKRAAKIARGLRAGLTVNLGASMPDKLAQVEVMESRATRPALKEENR
jgi:hypothetical protein